MLKGKCGNFLSPQGLWETTNLSTFLSTNEIKRSCGFEAFFHNFFAYYYCY